MMILTTLSEKKNDSQVRVFWRTGIQNRGILDVTLANPHPESALLAELMAIQHLMFERLVFDREPIKGGGYKLITSKGAIKKLAMGKSDKQFAVPLSQFLRHRLSGITIEVSQSREYLPTLDDCMPEELQADQDHYLQELSSDLVETPAMGSIVLTHHAVEQYASRIATGAPKDPRLSLIRRLMNPELINFPLSEKVLAHKARKYGRADNIEVWGHPTSNLSYQLVKDDSDRKVLVTVFRRDTN